MKHLKSILLVVLFSLGANHLFAHALWIETKTTGKAGQAQEIKVFYGEFANNEREEISKWYSDVKDFTLWLTAPGKEKIQLNKTEGNSFYSASFIPENDGLYIISVTHEAKELGGTTKYEFSSVATVAVGKATAINHELIPNLIKVSVNEAKIFKVNSPVQLKAILNNKPFANKPVLLFSSEGWSKQFTTDQNGNLTVHPIWPGRYVLEISNFENISGDHHGKSYTAIWQGSTSSFEVGK